MLIFKSFFKKIVVTFFLYGKIGFIHWKKSINFYFFRTVNFTYLLKQIRELKKICSLSLMNNNNTCNKNMHRKIIQTGKHKKTMSDSLMTHKEIA